MKKVLLILFTFLLIASCDYLKEKLPTTQEPIDFTKVDESPTFPECKGMDNKIMRKECFHDAVSTYLKTTLEGYDFSSSKVMNDQVVIHLEFGADGKAFLHEIEMSDEIREALPNLENVIHQSIMEFPTLIPAKKNNVDVTTRYSVLLTLEN